MPGGATGAPVEKDAEAGEQEVWSEDPLGCTGRNSFPSWGATGNGGIVFLGIKEITGANVRPCSLAQEQKPLFRAAGLGCQLFCYTLP